MKSLLAIIFASTLLLSCGYEGTIDPSAEIKYGTSFGMCIGYCYSETKISGLDGTITFESWRDEDLSPLSNSFQISEEERDNIVKGIDIEKFNELSEVIGCPDCADGGAEWLQISVEGKVKKVTFEYNRDIDGIAEAIEILRSLTQENKPNPSE